MLMAEFEVESIVAHKMNVSAYLVDGWWRECWAMAEDRAEAGRRSGPDDIEVGR